jgi:hypothetical protein
MAKYLTRTGRTVHLPISDITNVLFDANLISTWVEPPAIRRPPEVDWTVGAGDMSAEVRVVGHCRTCGQTFPVFGPHLELAVWSHCGVNMKVPKDILERFFQMTK